MHSPPFRSTRRRRLTAIAALTLGLLGAGLGLAPTAQAAAEHEYKPIAPVRVYETRVAAGLIPGTAVKPADNSVTKVKVVGDIPGDLNPPADADAVTVTVTGVESSANDNYLTVWDCTDAIGGTDGLEPDPPTASNLNLRVGDIRPNAVVSEVNGEGEICVYARNATHLLVDLTGYFPNGALTNGELTLLDAPTRILETRLGAPQVNYAGGKPVAGQVVKAPVPADSGNQILNITGVEGTGWLTVWDCTDANPNDAIGPGNITEPDPPTVSALNLEPGIIAANLAVTKASAGNEVCIFTSAGSHIIVDRIGSFPATSSYEGLVPKRVLETRAAAGPIPANAVKSTNNGTIALTLRGGPNSLTNVSAGAEAVVLNVTGTDSSTGFVTVYPCLGTDDPRPTVSNLNLVAGQTRANTVITKLGKEAGLSRICIYTQSATHLVVDLVGEFVPTPPA